MAHKQSKSHISRTDNAVAKSKRRRRQTMVGKILHKKIKKRSSVTNPTKNGVNSDSLEG